MTARCASAIPGAHRIGGATVRTKYRPCDRTRLSSSPPVRNSLRTAMSSSDVKQLAAAAIRIVASSATPGSINAENCLFVCRGAGAMPARQDAQFGVRSWHLAEHAELHMTPRRVICARGRVVEEQDVWIRDLNPVTDGGHFDLIFVGRGCGLQYLDQIPEHFLPAALGVPDESSTSGWPEMRDICPVDGSIEVLEPAKEEIVVVWRVGSEKPPFRQHPAPRHAPQLMAPRQRLRDKG